MPTATYPKDPNRVQWDTAQADPLFAAIRNDDVLPAPSPAPSVPAQPRPEEVKVTVVNGTKEAVRTLRARHFQVAAARGPVQAETRILYGPGAERQADALAVAVPGVRIVPDASVRPGTVTPGRRARRRPGTGGGDPRGKGEIKVEQNPCA